MVRDDAPTEIFLDADATVIVRAVGVMPLDAEALAALGPPYRPSVVIRVIRGYNHHPQWVRSL